MSKALEQLKEYLQISKQYEHVTSLLYWDMEASVPREGYEGHADALAYFSTEHFKRSTSEELEKLLDVLNQPEEFEQLDANWQFIVKRMKRELDRDKNIPVDFYNEYVKEQAASGQAWQDAKKAADFSIFAPHLEKMIAMTKEITGYRFPGKPVFDALLDTYEEGMDSATYDRLFEELKAGILPLVEKIRKAKQPDLSMFDRSYSILGQKAVERMLLEYIGFSFEKGTTGETEHPFTLNMSSKDVRVSNHFHEDDAIDPMFSAIHEGGHAVFEQNVNPELDGTVGGSCCYLGIHESQSRFYENILGRNRNFWLPIYSKLQELLPEFKEISLDDFYRKINQVQSSFIRTAADEVTYCLHVILRYEIEREIFENDVPVSELPKLWNQKMKEYLNITPENDAKGILQDMHWSDGSFGYFPTYALGSIYDGMFLEAITKELGNLDEILAAGDIKKITRWLNEKIHQYGSTKLPKQIIEDVCHKEISALPLVSYFKQKYTEIYGLDPM